MYTLKEVAAQLNISENNLRYILKNNENDVEYNNYEYSLKNLITKYPILKVTKGVKKYHRHYITSFVLDIDEFINKFINYKEYKNNLKKKNYINRLWSASAIECWENNMNCKKCSNYAICRNVSIEKNLLEPPMKKIVKGLIIKYGNPQILERT